MKISIIIPTIGRKTLSQVLQSILNMRDYSTEIVEVVVVGDGNFSREFILNNENFAEFKFLSTKKNVGASGARNLGIEQATGEIIAFIGDDTILDKMWLAETTRFHLENPAKNYALLGKINWVDKFKNDPFYKWLNNYAQFSFRRIRLHGAKWNNFYTSNISLKREFLGSQRFFAGFTGWGFEDSELGYRLYKKGMNLIYDPGVIVYHDHKQTIDDVVRNFQNARKNAEIFEKLHPELHIIPRGHKLEILKKMVKIAGFFAPVIPQAEWWYKWKKAWIEEE
jgi:GT2 family glycosyltransferase